MFYEKHVIRTLVVFAFLSFTSGRHFIFCPPEWESTGSGNLHVLKMPLNVLWVQESTLVGSLLAANGTVSHTTRKISVLIDDLQQEFATYQVLKLPAFCKSEWIGTKNGNIPANAIPISSEQVHIGVIGRAHTISGCGWVDLTDGVLKLEKGRRITQYEVLTSEFPPLEAELTDFQFQVPALSQTSLQRELLGSTSLEIEGGVSNSKLEYAIEHSRTFQELLLLREIPFDWFGVNAVNITLQLFYGSRDLVKVIGHQLDYLQDTGMVG